MRLSDSAAGPRPAETIRRSLVSFALEPKVWPMMRSAVSRMSSQTSSGSLPATPIKVVLLVAHSFVSARFTFAVDWTIAITFNLLRSAVVSARITFAVEKTIAILLNLCRFAVAEQIQSDCISGFLGQFDVTLDVLRQPAFLNALDPRDDVARFQLLQCPSPFGLLHGLRCHPDLRRKCLPGLLGLDSRLMFARQPT